MNDVVKRLKDELAWHEQEVPEAVRGRHVEELVRDALAHIAELEKRALPGDIASAHWRDDDEVMYYVDLQTDGQWAWGYLPEMRAQQGYAATYEEAIAAAIAAADEPPVP